MVVQGGDKAKFSTRIKSATYVVPLSPLRNASALNFRCRHVNAHCREEQYKDLRKGEDLGFTTILFAKGLEGITDPDLLSIPEGQRDRPTGDEGIK